MTLFIVCIATMQVLISVSQKTNKLPRSTAVICLIQEYFGSDLDKRIIETVSVQTKGTGAKLLICCLVC